MSKTQGDPPRESPLPKTPLSGPAVWTGAELGSDPSWKVNLTADQVGELTAAARASLNSGMRIEEITSASFDLPGLRSSLLEHRKEVLRGRGFVVFHGLPITELTRKEVAAIFWGLGSYLGKARVQNSAGHLLGHVIDLGMASSDPSVRIYQTHERQGYHTDSADIVGLLCLETALRGGLSSLVSIASVFNRMLASCPEHLPTLFADFCTDHRGEAPPGAEPYFRAPILHWHAGELSVLYQRAYIESAQRYPDVPPLNATQTAALDALDSILEDPQVHLQMQLEPGDMQFIHNHQLLHDRTAFENGPGQERHLLRLWLSPRDGRSLPACFAERYGSLVPGQRGGVRLPEGVTPTAPLSPSDSK
ncbi:MAG: TauD/TfdA family dioxygenase [Planctomycetota bacterium]|jgi:hypothetical protein